jgi:hypothetical protein
MGKLTVFKYSLQPMVMGETAIKMPVGADPLHIAVQNGYPQLWAKVDPDAPIVDRRIVALGTGHPFGGAEGKYLGTTIHANGHLVIHFFDEAPALSLSKPQEGK